jgi:hypothetical protein
MVCDQPALFLQMFSRWRVTLKLPRHSHLALSPLQPSPDLAIPLSISSTTFPKMSDISFNQLELREHVLQRCGCCRGRPEVLNGRAVPECMKPPMWTVMAAIWYDEVL